MISAVSSAVQGIMNSMWRMDRAAALVSRSGLSDAPPSSSSAASPVAGAPSADPTDLAGATVDMLMAQRAFSAQLRVLRTADEMSREAVNLLRR